MTWLRHDTCTSPHPPTPPHTHTPRALWLPCSAEHMPGQATTSIRPAHRSQDCAPRPPAMPHRPFPALPPNHHPNRPNQPPQPPTSRLNLLQPHRRLRPGPLRLLQQVEEGGGRCDDHHGGVAGGEAGAPRPAGQCLFRGAEGVHRGAAGQLCSAQVLGVLLGEQDGGHQHHHNHGCGCGGGSHASASSRGRGRRQAGADQAPAWRLPAGRRPFCGWPHVGSYVSPSTSGCM